MKEFLKPLWLSQLFPKPRAEGPWWANPLSDRESKRKRKGKQGLGGRRGSERKADDISNLYPLQFQRNYKVLRAYKTLQMMSALNCVNTNCGVTASHTSGGQRHDSHGHKTATSSEHAEKREKEEENEIITEKTGIYTHSSNAVPVGLCTVVCFWRSKYAVDKLLRLTAAHSEKWDPKKLKTILIYLFTDMIVCQST